MKTNGNSKLIIDTDIGDDIDDTLAIMMTLFARECPLIGVTTVFKNAPLRAHLARYVLDGLHCDVPVYAGISTPMLNHIERLLGDEVIRNEARDQRGNLYPAQYIPECARKYQGDDAVRFIIESAHKYPGELVLAPIGALTNIAAAITLDRSIVGKIKQINMMGGTCDGGSDIKEWNILCDPEAAKIVIESGIPIYMIGLNVTMQCELPNDALHAIVDRFRDDMPLLPAMVEKWFAYYKQPCSILHDPLAVATVTHPFVRFVKRKAAVLLDGDDRGRILQDDIPAGQSWGEMYMSDGVDAQAFVDWFVALLRG